MAFTTQTYGALAGFPPSAFALGSPIDVGGAYVLPPTGRIFFVRGDGSTVSVLDDQYTSQSSKTQKCFPSVKSILDLGLCKANRGDTIVCLPGHAENIAGADYWAFVAGLRIVGIKWGTLIPTFTFTGTTTSLGQVKMNDANCSISGCRFLCAGPAGTTALTVTAPFVMSAAGCSLTDNQFEIGIDADQICTTFLTISAANCTFSRNRVETAAVAAEITNCIVLTGASNLVMEDNAIKAVVSAATGVVTHTSASTNLRICRNFIHSWKASSTHVLNFGAFASTGLIENNVLRMELASDITSALTLNAACDFTCNGNTVCNEKNKTTVAIGTAVDA